VSRKKAKPQFDADPLDDDEDAVPFVIDDNGTMILKRGGKDAGERRAVGNRSRVGQKVPGPAGPKPGKKTPRRKR
jgi:hypothetical protein